MNYQKIKRFWVAFFATAAGSGFTPKAPGTAGTVMGVLLVYSLRSVEMNQQILFFLALFLVGWWASFEWSKLTQLKDAQTIVIDEVLGYWLTVLLTQKFYPELDFTILLWSAFVAFRIFDVLKPPPIRQLDCWGKHFAIGPLQSVMVIVDDLLASVYAMFFIVLCFRWLHL